MSKRMSDEMTKALAALTEARQAFDVAESDAKAASSVETAARNRLNEAQRAFDVAVGNVKKGAPWNTDWSQRNRTPVETP